MDMPSGSVRIFRHCLHYLVTLFTLFSYCSVGDCGHPVAKRGGVGKCPSCGVVVGGQGYNRFVDGGDSSESRGVTQLRDETREGHILGPAPRLFQRPRPERSLSGLQVAMTRFMLHASMAVGKCFNAQK